MAAVNYYLGVKRGANLSINQVTAAASTAGTAVDVEVRLQINDGSNATGLTREGALLAMEVLESFIESGGNNHDGQFLPAL